MENNRVSVVVPTYNRANHITKSLNSAWEQTYRPIEVLVVDDGSTDDTREVVEEWKKNHKDDTFKTKYIYQENAGAPTARNTGIKNANGRYLQFLDSDDVLMPEKLALQIELMQKEKTSICICNYIHVNRKGCVLESVDNNRTMNQIIESTIGLSTIISVIDRSFFNEDILKWNPNLKKFQDRDFHHKIFFVVEEFSFVNKSLFKWIRHEEERIFDSIPHTKKIHWESLKSLLIFHLKHWRSVQSEKLLSIFYLYFKLFKRTVKIGRFIPELLKFWR
jgi:glycosyltransferase involved in cell wall biosynthesis